MTFKVHLNQYLKCAECRLQNFAFSIELSLEIFLVGTVMALIVAWITVGGQAAKAAMARPVDSLKYE
ncbi:MAG: hypothetical protein HRT38_20035 [Alteromonadaceae bacterium]|nr:hypothetical protein [Alteromonadaceae bacterium]